MTAPPPVADARRPRLDARAVALLLACTAVWGLAQVAAKVALVEVPPLWQAAVRSTGAALLLLAWSRSRGLKVFAADATARAGWLAGALFAAEFGCIFVGLQYTSASRMSVFLYLAPFVVAAGMPAIAPGERLGGAALAGLALAFAGVVWAFAGGFAEGAPQAGPGQWLGDALGIAAGVLWGATTLVLRASRLATALPEKTLLYQLAVSGAALLAASMAAGERWPDPIALAPLTIASLLFQTAIVTFASYLAWFWLVRHYAAARLAAFTLATPVFGLLAGVALLGEPLTVRLVVALAAVGIGLALVNRSPRGG